MILFFNRTEPTCELHCSLYSTALVAQLISATISGQHLGEGCSMGRPRLSQGGAVGAFTYTAAWPIVNYAARSRAASRAFAFGMLVRGGARRATVKRLLDRQRLVVKSRRCRGVY